MFCSNCGNELPDNAKFCQKCGKGIGQASSDVATEEKPASKPAAKKLSWKQKWQRKPKWQKVAGVIGLIIGLTWAFGDAFKGFNSADNWFGSDSVIDIVRDGHIEGYLDCTLGEVAEKYFEDLAWKQTEIYGKPYVNLTGKIESLEGFVNVFMQFRVDKKANSFEITTLQFNGVPQSWEMIAEVVEAMYMLCGF